MILTHVAGAHMWAHTQSSPAVLGAMVLIEDTEASYWLLADVQQPITALHQLASQRYREQNILQACLSVCGCVWVFYSATPSQTIDI